MIVKIFKFLISGSISTIINYSIFYFLHNIFDEFYILCSSAGYILGLLFGYFLNKNWTFINQITLSNNYLIPYFAAYSLSLVISQFLLYILVNNYYFDPKIANLGAIAFSTIMNFLSTNFIIFKIR